MKCSRFALSVLLAVLGGAVAALGPGDGHGGIAAGLDPTPPASTQPSEDLQPASATEFTGGETPDHFDDGPIPGDELAAQDSSNSQSPTYRYEYPEYPDDQHRSEGGAAVEQPAQDADCEAAEENADENDTQKTANADEEMEDLAGVAEGEDKETVKDEEEGTVEQDADDEDGDDKDGDDEDEDDEDEDADDEAVEVSREGTAEMPQTDAPKPAAEDDSMPAPMSHDTSYDQGPWQPGFGCKYGYRYGHKYGYEYALPDALPSGQEPVVPQTEAKNEVKEPSYLGYSFAYPDEEYAYRESEAQPAAQPAGEQATTENQPAAGQGASGEGVESPFGKDFGYEHVHPEMYYGKPQPETPDSVGGDSPEADNADRLLDELEATYRFRARYEGEPGEAIGRLMVDEPRSFFYVDPVEYDRFDYYAQDAVRAREAGRLARDTETVEGDRNLTADAYAEPDDPPAAAQQSAAGEQATPTAERLFEALKAAILGTVQQLGDAALNASLEFSRTNWLSLVTGSDAGQAAVPSGRAQL